MPKAMHAAARTLAAVPIFLTLLPLQRSGKGWVRMWDFPRVQIAWLGALGGALLLPWAHRLVDRGMLVGLAGSLLYQASRIWPYTPFSSKQVPAAQGERKDRRICLLMCNVLQSNRCSEKVRQAVREADADVLCFVETDDWWERELRPLERDYPWFNKCPLDNTYGMLLYSRLPLTNTETRCLVQPDVPSMRTIVELRSGEKMVLHAVHPRPPAPNSPSYGRDAELVFVGREVEKEKQAAVVIGDLNDVAWSYTTTLFQRVSHTLDPRIGRGMYNTFNADHWWARWPLDHVFHTRHFSLVELRRLPHVGSDHFPILVELQYNPSRKHEMERPHLDEGDKQEVRRIVEDAREKA